MILSRLHLVYVQILAKFSSKIRSDKKPDRNNVGLARFTCTVFQSFRG